MPDPTSDDQAQDAEAHEDLDLDDGAADAVRGGAFEPYVSIKGQKQGPTQPPPTQS